MNWRELLTGGLEQDDVGYVCNLWNQQAEFDFTTNSRNTVTFLSQVGTCLLYEVYQETISLQANRRQDVLFVHKTSSIEPRSIIKQVDCNHRA